MLEEAIRIAQVARSKAYCPYSSYAVGACIAFKIDGGIRTQSGCNVENASFGLSICAERSAVFGAVGIHGKVSVELVVVATKDGGTPCGACLQVLSEFAPEGCRVVCVDELGRTKDFQLGELMPHAFTSKALETEN